MYRRDRRRLFDTPTVKTEVLSLRPLIMVFRDIVNASEQKAVAHIGYEQVTNGLDTDKFVYFTIKLSGCKIQTLLNLRTSVEHIITQCSINFKSKSCKLETRKRTKLVV